MLYNTFEIHEKHEHYLYATLLPHPPKQNYFLGVFHLQFNYIRLIQQQDGNVRRQ